MMAYEMLAHLRHLVLTPGTWSDDDVFVGTDKQREAMRLEVHTFENERV